VSFCFVQAKRLHTLYVNFTLKGAAEEMSHSKLSGNLFSYWCVE